MAGGGTDPGSAAAAVSGGTPPRIQLHASPFVPGRASGVVQRLPAASASGILLLPFTELDQLSQLPAGLIVIGGAPLAHPMIRLYSHAIPTVVVTAEQATLLPEGSRVSVDGYSGWISSEATAPPPPSPPATPVAGEPVFTADGIPIELRASVASAAGVAEALAQGASAIGMVRSEFMLPPHDGVPDEPFYFQALQNLCERAGRLPITIRLLDLAPDKHPAWLGTLPGMSGPLGLRGARLYHHEPVRSVFCAELRAIARLADSHAIRLLLPYMTRPEEFAPLHEEIRKTLSRPLPLGVMIETPAAALALPEWLQLVDFVVIGCNDLMQCLFAADRDIPAVAPLLDPYAPVLYRFLRQMAPKDDAQRQRIQLGGVLPLVPGVLPLLIGLGFRHFSVEPLLTPCLAAVVAGCDTGMAQRLADRVCAAHDSDEVRALLELPGQFRWGSGGH